MTGNEKGERIVSAERRPLNRPTIIAEALDLVRREGIDAVTMRRLGQELSTSPMALYRHVEDRQGILVGMLDEVAAQITLPEEAADPRSEITAVATAIHNALGRDPWAVNLIVSEKLASPRILPAIERMFAALSNAGLQPRDVSVAYALIWHYTVGELIDTHHIIPDNFSQNMVRNADETQFPTLTAIVSTLPTGPPGDHFPENLQRILDGLLRINPGDHT